MGRLSPGESMPVCPRWFLRLWVLAGVASGVAAAGAPPALAEAVLERVARTGELRLIGPVDLPPMLSRDVQGQPQGYGALIAERITAVVAQALGKPVRLVYEAVSDSASLSQQLGEGNAELACSMPFTWSRDEVVDYTLPLGVSSLRLLAPSGRLDGSPASLAGRRIGVVADSLAETQLRGMQPTARVQTFADLPAALGALGAGKVQGVIGDSLLLAALAQQQGLKGVSLTPSAPYLRYGVVCAVPENNSRFRSLANRAIAQLQQGYIDGNPADVAAVNRWLGPGTGANLSTEQIRGVFDALLLGVEPLRPLP